jgi:hypothetical protein
MAGRREWTRESLAAGVFLQRAVAAGAAVVG